MGFKEKKQAESSLGGLGDSNYLLVDCFRYLFFWGTGFEKLLCFSAYLYVLFGSVVLNRELGVYKIVGLA